MLGDVRLTDYHTMVCQHLAKLRYPASFCWGCFILATIVSCEIFRNTSWNRIISFHQSVNMSMVMRTIALTGYLAVALSVVVSLITLYESSQGNNIAQHKAGTYDPYREFNIMVNNYFFQYSGLGVIQSYYIEKFGSELGYYLSAYTRDLIVGFFVYWITAGLWHLTIYYAKGKELFSDKGRQLPTSETILDQVMLAQSSLFFYATLPILSEYLIENKYTKAYYYLDEVGGWQYYVLYLVVYMACVEFGIYWVHRTLHENKFLYKYVHALHHKYNKPTTLTPWCSIAFNPIDGLLQASPYVFFLFFIPVHYFTHIFLLFFTGVWATNIHDALWSDSEPIMGSKYHTVHHTHYHYNYGQFFIFWDYVFGTLRVPDKSKFD